MENPYDLKAKEYVAQYLSVSSSNIHHHWINQIPDTPSRILDIGTGSGRDAVWLAKMGHEITAIDSSSQMLNFANNLSLKSGCTIDFRKDSIPELTTFKKESGEFALILVNAVWMHLTEEKRKRAFRKLTNLLSPGGKLVISLRHGPSPDRRKMYEVSTKETRLFAQNNALNEIIHLTSPDSLGRPGVNWETFVFELPDDGTGALPLLRHIIVNDGKTATYKLVLLKVLLRIATGATGIVKRTKNQRQVEIPFGLVALYWMKILYKPVIENGVIQLPYNKKNYIPKNMVSFYNLKNQDIGYYELEIGSSFSGEKATALFYSLKEARDLIRKMPANYITFPGNKPGNNSQVFITDVNITLYKQRFTEFVINPEFLGQFGTISVPAHIFDAMTRYGVWIEPAIDNEWVSMMNNFNKENPQVTNEVRYTLHDLIQWEDIERNQKKVRPIVNELIETQTVRCVWSGKKLRYDDFAVDHLFPFAHWPNNDYWNLLPTDKTVNGSKSDKLITPTRLNEATRRIFNWWEAAYSHHPHENTIFFDEAAVSLPHNQEGAITNFNQVIGGIELQRRRLKTHYQLQEWR